MRRCRRHPGRASTPSPAKDSPKPSRAPQSSSTCRTRPRSRTHAVLEFFQTSTRNLLAAEAAAGVGHHVALSIVGIDRSAGQRLLPRQARAGEADRSGSSIPYSIVRATQFFEFVDGHRRRRDRRQRRSTWRPRSFQPMAADDVARAVAEVAVGSPLNGRRRDRRSRAAPVRRAHPPRLRRATIRVRWSPIRTRRTSARFRASSRSSRSTARSSARSGSRTGSTSRAIQTVTSIVAFRSAGWIGERCRSGSSKQEILREHDNPQVPQRFPSVVLEPAAQALADALATAAVRRSTRFPRTMLAPCSTGRSPATSPWRRPSRAHTIPGGPNWRDLDHRRPARGQQRQPARGRVHARWRLGPRQLRAPMSDWCAIWPRKRRSVRLRQLHARRPKPAIRWRSSRCTPRRSGSPSMERNWGWTAAGWPSPAKASAAT